MRLLVVSVVVCECDKSSSLTHSTVHLPKMFRRLLSVRIRFESVHKYSVIELSYLTKLEVEVVIWDRMGATILTGCIKVCTPGHRA